MRSISLLGVPNMPLIAPGDGLAAIICRCAAGSGLDIQENDVVVIAQKIVSKAEGRLVKLADVVPSSRARELAEVTKKDPRFVEVVLSDTDHVLRAGEGLLIVEQRLASASSAPTPVWIAPTSHPPKGRLSLSCPSIPTRRPGESARISVRSRAGLWR